MMYDAQNRFDRLVNELVKLDKKKRKKNASDKGCTRED